MSPLFYHIRVVITRLFLGEKRGHAKDIGRYSVENPDTVFVEMRDGILWLGQISERGMDVFDPAR